MRENQRGRAWEFATAVTVMEQEKLVQCAVCVYNSLAAIFPFELLSRLAVKFGPDRTRLFQAKPAYSDVILYPSSAYLVTYLRLLLMKASSVHCEYIVPF